MIFIFFRLEKNGLSDHVGYWSIILWIFGAIIFQVLLCIEKVSYGTGRIITCDTYISTTWLRDNNLAMSEIDFGKEMKFELLLQS